MRFSFLLLFLATPAFASIEYKCRPGDPLALDFQSPAAARAGCAAAASQAQCSATVEKLLEANPKLKRLRELSCEHMESITQDMADVGPQSNSYKKITDITDSALSDSKEYLQQLNIQYRQILATLTNTQGGPLAPPVAQPGAAAVTVAAAGNDPVEQAKQQLRSRVTDPAKVKQLTGLAPAPTISDIKMSVGREDPGLFAAVNGANYLRKILKESDEISTRIDNLQKVHDGAEDNLSKNGNPQNNNDDKPAKTGPSTVSEGSGLDMKTLTGLATAGAALAPLLQKKDAASNSDNSASTSPTPDSTNAPVANAPESSKLGDDKGAQSQPPVAGPAPKKEDPTNPNRVPSGTSFQDASDVSHSQSAFGSGATSASGAAPSSRSGGGSGGAPAGMGGDGGAEPAATAAAKNPAASGGDDTVGIGGGNLGGGGPPSLGGAPMGGDPAAAAATSPEDSMKDLLHEMKETAEGANSPNLQASNADIPMTDEDLFPRVRNAYVRALKQGRILDSLAEKVTEENQ